MKGGGKKRHSVASVSPVAFESVAEGGWEAERGRTWGGAQVGRVHPEPQRRAARSDFWTTLTSWTFAFASRTWCKSPSSLTVNLFSEVSDPKSCEKKDFFFLLD